ncbi:MAG: DUF2076 domain-containing protein [Buchnera aphidicola (Eriosoma harunire)]
MKIIEEQLIENLFHKLDVVEKKSQGRNITAEKLIQSRIDKQCHAPYYMVQTILIQDTVLKKLNNKILDLEKQVLSYKNKLRSEVSKSDFLPNMSKNNDDVQSNKTTNLSNSCSNNTVPSSGAVLSDNNSFSTRNSSALSSGYSFLSNALQTAVGVASGMVVGNMLMNLFKNKQPEEEILMSSNDDASVSKHHYEDVCALDNNDLYYDEYLNTQHKFISDDDENFNVHELEKDSIVDSYNDEFSNSINDDNFI